MDPKMKAPMELLEDDMVQFANVGSLIATVSFMAPSWFVPRNMENFSVHLLIRLT